MEVFISMQLKIQQDKDTDDLLPGEAIVVENNGKLQLILCCPGCGKTSGSAGSHVYDPITQSYHPSIVHNPTLGGCGYHGWLRNGIFYLA